MKKIKYNLSDNEKFRYFIVSHKIEIELDENSVSFKIDKTKDKSTITSGTGIESNYDLIIFEMDKNDNFIRQIPCMYDEIEE